MAIITISRGSYSHGKEIAEKTAQKLGYECISREVLIEASKHFNVPEIKLLKAIENAPSFLDRFTYGKEKYVAYVKAALLNHLKKDNVVYHGFAGHYFVKDVPHALKVRIIANMEDRIKLVMEKEKVEREKAEKIIKKLDEERARWGKSLYGIDTRDPSLYDLVIHIDRLNIDDAVEIICYTVKLDRFKTTPEAKKQIEDLALAAEVKAAIIDIAPEAEVLSKDGQVKIHLRTLLIREEEVTEKVREIVSTIEGVREISIETEPFIIS